MQRAASAPARDGDTWLYVGDQPLDSAAAAQWCRRHDVGAVVTFAGLVRDHALDSDGELRRGVQYLDYEAYTEQIDHVLADIVDQARHRWPAIGPVALHHRTGRVLLGEDAVVIVVGAGHRAEAFAAAHWLIDAVKASAPIWKYESWEHGGGWGTAATPIVPPEEVVR